MGFRSAVSIYLGQIRDRLKHLQHKHFLRFKSPVYYLDTEGKWKQAGDEFETWVSVADK